ncbi:MAG TPA: hypothetical protein VHW23_13370 [Kofleriaceae bacterium]|jgi:hypothetical protein|nr:hypothetical protein [Kofleriaceae bacterium]
MRRLPAAILVSVASHALVFGWLAWSGRVLAVPLGAPPRPPPSEASPAPAPAAPEVIALVLLDAQGAPAAPVPPTVPLAPHADRVSARDRRGETALAIATGRAPGAAAATDPTADRRDEASAGPARSPWLSMRRPPPPELPGLSQSFIDQFLAHTRPLAPPPDTPERLLDERDELRRGHRDIARIVALNDQIARQDLKPSGGGTYRAEQPTFTTRVDADGNAHVEDKPRELDTQDRLMQRMGIDPYARNKLALLDRTRDQRVAIGERHRTAQLAHAAELMQHNIDRLWATVPDLAARKRGLFELWDDCAETGSDELGAGAGAARRLVIGVIHARLRGADAYTAAELAELNAIRRSTAVFAPYE